MLVSIPLKYLDTRQGGGGKKNSKSLASFRQKLKVLGGPRCSQTRCTVASPSPRSLLKMQTLNLQPHFPEPGQSLLGISVCLLVVLEGLRIASQRSKASPSSVSELHPVALRGCNKKAGVPLRGQNNPSEGISSD